jgi:molybdopterin molybdotransferase
VRTVTFPEAREIVISQVLKHRSMPATEAIAFSDAESRVLAEPLCADRDYPPVPRSIRDGYAVRAADLPGTLRVIGEVRAGERYQGSLAGGQAIEIMTGAPVPAGADAVVMVEHTSRDGELMTTSRAPKPGEFINPRGTEARSGDVVLEAGKRLEFASVALAATFGITKLAVYRRPSVAILATGDEIVEPGEPVYPWQIRNSNAWSQATQVRRAGGLPDVLPVARDTLEHTRNLVEKGLEHDLLLLSGGVSAGKYDVVERALAECGAEFYFDRVLIQPGQPLVFGRARGRFFFGLPGNPASTMVTFEIFARAAVELLGGQNESRLPLTRATLTKDFRHNPGLTRFLPADLQGDRLTPIPWAGSSDVPAVARANAFLVADPDKEHYKTGDDIHVLLKT